jgi:hypothetical protein
VTIDETLKPIGVLDAESEKSLFELYIHSDCTHCLGGREPFQHRLAISKHVQKAFRSKQSHQSRREQHPHRHNSVIA